MGNYVLILILFIVLIFNSYALILKERSGKFLNSQNNISVNNSKSTLKDIYKNIKSCLFINSQNNKSALINLKIKNTPTLYSVGNHKSQFVIMSGSENEILRVTKDFTKLTGKTLLANSLKVTGQVTYNGIPQWRLVKHDTFSKNNTSLDWSHDKTTECSSHKILGGYCQTSQKELVKKYDDLPPHSMLRIEANFHFLGSWDSHSGYLKVDSGESESKATANYIWVHRCKNHKSPLADIQLCPHLKVCKLGLPINSTINHKARSIRLIFGSSLEGNACEQSYGISDVKIYIR